MQCRVMSPQQNWGLNISLVIVKQAEYAPLIIQAYVIKCNETIYKSPTTTNDNLKNVQPH